MENVTEIDEVSQDVGNQFFYSLAEVLRAAENFLNSFELVFHQDWDYSRAILESENQHHYIAPGATFLHPGVADTSSNWWNRGTLLWRYERLRAALDRHSQNTERLQLALRPAPERIQ